MLRPYLFPRDVVELKMYPKVHAKDLAVQVNSKGRVSYYHGGREWKGAERASRQLECSACTAICGLFGRVDRGAIRGNCEETVSGC
jgi:hypothetical protein